MSLLLRTCLLQSRSNTRYYTQLISSMSNLNCTPIAARTISGSSVLHDQVQKKEQEPQSPSAGTSSVNESVNLNKAYKPDNLERRFLVWTGKYKSFEEVPERVGRDEMERCRSTIRIRLSNILMALTLVGCIFMVRSGKKAAEKGETLQKINQDWHKTVNEEKAK